MLRRHKHVLSLAYLKGAFAKGCFLIFFFFLSPRLLVDFFFFGGGGSGEPEPGPGTYQTGMVGFFSIS